MQACALITALALGKAYRPLFLHITMVLGLCQHQDRIYYIMHLCCRIRHQRDQTLRTRRLQVGVMPLACACRAACVYARFTD